MYGAENNLACWQSRNMAEKGVLLSDQVLQWDMDFVLKMNNKPRFVDFFHPVLYAIVSLQTAIGYQLQPYKPNKQRTHYVSCQRLCLTVFEEA